MYTIASSHKPSRKHSKISSRSKSSKKRKKSTTDSQKNDGGSNKNLNKSTASHAKRDKSVDSGSSKHKSHKNTKIKVIKNASDVYKTALVCKILNFLQVSCFKFIKCFSLKSWNIAQVKAKMEQKSDKTLNSSKFSKFHNNLSRFWRRRRRHKKDEQQSHQYKATGCNRFRRNKSASAGYDNIFKINLWCFRPNTFELTSKKVNCKDQYSE